MELAQYLKVVNAFGGKEQFSTRNLVSPLHKH